MFFKSSPRKKLIKQAETTVHLAKKVLAYRKDVLDPADVESITRLRGELLRLKKDKGSTGKALEQANRELDKVLKELGVEKIKTVGEKFDHSLHEAVEMKEGEGNSGEIFEEVAAGFKINGKVIRPAKVRVAK